MKHLWLDLEDTIITPVMEGWFNTHLVNTDKIDRVLATWKPDFVLLFSFAIHDREELKRFNLGTRSMIENRFGFILSTTWTVDGDIIPMCCREMGLSTHAVDFMDASAFWSKHQAFRLCMRQFFGTTHRHEVDTEVLLLDDAVHHEEFRWPDLRVSGTILNIDSPTFDHAISSLNPS
jgi:hypothetical protein